MGRLNQEKSKLEYRPEGWTNPCADELEKNIFEAGANAMLQMLLNEAHEYGQTAHHYLRHDDYLCDVLAQGIQLR
jgi:hypothetical protein